MAENPYDQFGSGNPYDQFESTAGGAAVGNPMIRRQGERRSNAQTAGEAIATIGGAGAAGAAMGAAAPELLMGASTVARGLPPPMSGLAGPLSFMSQAARTLGRPAGAIVGGISGTTGETAGQIAEGMGASPMVAEGARFGGGILGGEAITFAKSIAQKYLTVPALGLESKIKKEVAKGILEKLNAGVKTLSAQERDFLEKSIAEVRGAPKSNDALEEVGSIMGQQGQRIMSASDLQMMNALRQQGTVGNAGNFPAVERNLADVGGDLQKSIVTRNKIALEARDAAFKGNERARDDIVGQMESSGKFPKDLPEYAAIVKSLEQELAPGVRSNDVRKSFENILSEIKTKVEQPTLTNRQTMGYDPKPAPKETPATFQRIDDLRRQLGEVYRGKPPEGYEGIDAATAKKYYGMLSDLQKTYAGTPQARLLDDYAARTEGLEVFSSRLGKKVTALDQYREGQYPDPSAIPPAFFKSKASVQALRELTGNARQVEEAGLAFANRELAGKNAQAVRTWRNDNSEWLDELGPTKRLIDSYASRLDASERALLQAQNFAKQAEKDASMLIGKSLPAQRAVDLIKSGDTELWSKVIPAINQSPQAKTQMVAAARQVLGDMASSKGTSDFFARNLRPFLEQSNIATKAEMDAVAASLDKIQKGVLPEQQKLKTMQRLMLNSFGGYTATAAARGGVGGYGLLSEQIPQ